MDNQNKNILFVAASTVFLIINTILCPTIASAWGDNSEDGRGRPSYTTEEIEKGILGDKIVLNSISDNTDLHEEGGSEKNYVAAMACIQQEDGNWEGVIEDTVWSNNDITVENGKYYIIRMYLRNDNPNGEEAVAEDIHVSFSIPMDYDQENKCIQVNGFIDSSNAIPSEYWDYVNFKSDTPFRLEYIYGSALLENKGIGLGGLPLSDDIVKSKSGGTLIGYNALDGKIPGGLQYASYVTVKVRAVFEYKYSVEQKVRLADSTDRTWKDFVDAKVGDKVEFRIGYENTSDKTQSVVAIKDILPANLKYIDGSTILRNNNHRKGARVIEDSIVTNGIRIGSYDSGANAYIYFLAEVVDEDLDQGLNILTNWAQVGVGDVTIQDSVEIRVRNDRKYYITLTVYGAIIVICLLIIVVMTWRIVKRNNYKRVKRQK